MVHILYIFIMYKLYQYKMLTIFFFQREINKKILFLKLFISWFNITVIS